MKIIILSFLACVAFSSASFAQSSADFKRGEFYIGYSANVLDDGGSNVNVSSRIFHGVEVSGVYNFTRYIGVKGDFSTHHKSTSGSLSSLQNFLGGIQIKDNSRDGKAKPFFHALAGGGRIGSGGSSVNGFALAIGGGFDYAVTKKVSIRVIQVDYNPFFANGGSSHNVRLGAGVVF